MGIDSITLGMNGTSWGAYNQKLTQATRNKLEELGIPYTETTTESEGKRLILAHQNNVKENDSFSQNEQFGKDSLFEKAKQLAKKVGLNVEENIDFEELLRQIEAKLEERISLNKGNISLLEELNGYSRDLASIQAQSKGSLGLQGNSNEALMMSLELLSQYNKNSLFNN